MREQVERMRCERGLRLCLRSPLVALKAAAQVGLVSVVAGLAAGWYCLHRVPNLVLVANQGVTLTLVAALFTVALVGGLAGYATARFAHSRSIRHRGTVAAGGVGLLLGCIVGGGLVAALAPWSFPSAHVVAVPPIEAGLYLTQHEVKGGMVLYQNDKPVACLETDVGRWIEAIVPNEAVRSVISQIPPEGFMTPQQVLDAIGNGQQAVLPRLTRRVWVVAVVLMTWVVVAATLQRHQWREAPWPVPGPRDVRQTMTWALRRAG